MKAKCVNLWLKPARILSYGLSLVGSTKTTIIMCVENCHQWSCKKVSACENQISTQHLNTGIQNFFLNITIKFRKKILSYFHCLHLIVIIVTIIIVIIIIIIIKIIIVIIRRVDTSCMAEGAMIIITTIIIIIIILIIIIIIIKITILMIRSVDA